MILKNIKKLKDFIFFKKESNKNTEKLKEDELEEQKNKKMLPKIKQLKI